MVEPLMKSWRMRWRPAAEGLKTAWAVQAKRASTSTREWPGKAILEVDRPPKVVAGTGGDPGSKEFALSFAEGMFADACYNGVSRSVAIHVGLVEEERKNVS